MAESHDLMGGRLHVYRRENSRFWQCSTFLNGRNWRVSTKEDSLSHAKDFAEDWYLELRGKSRAGQLKVGKTFRQAAEKFLHEYEVITLGERNPAYVAQKEEKLRVHLLPFFGDTILADITPGMVQDYRVHRQTSRKHKTTGEPLRPARSTIHHEIVTLRQVLRTANHHGWLEHLPDLSTPYKTSGKVAHRAWFSPEEYRRLYEATRKRAKSPPRERWRWSYEQLHDYVLFMANTGLRPDEASRLQFQDVAVVRDAGTDETILEIEVRQGKRGFGYAKSMVGAVQPFHRLRQRPRPAAGDDHGYRHVTRSLEGYAPPAATDALFPTSPRELLNEVLDDLGLKTDRQGHRRTAYSLRHTYICLRLMEGADIYQIAKNCRTSVEMIEKFYAAHIKNMIDASAINVRRPRTRREDTDTTLKSRRHKPVEKELDR